MACHGREAPCARLAEQGSFLSLPRRPHMPHVRKERTHEDGERAHTCAGHQRNVREERDQVHAYVQQERRLAGVRVGLMCAFGYCTRSCGPAAAVASVCSSPSTFFAHFQPGFRCMLLQLKRGGARLVRKDCRQSSLAVRVVPSPPPPSSLSPPFPLFHPPLLHTPCRSVAYHATRRSLNGFHGTICMCMSTSCPHYRHRAQ